MTKIVLKTLLDAVEISPDNGPLRFYLAEALRKDSQWAEAANEYLVALRLDGVSIEKARFGLAQVLLYLNKPVAGIELVESLLELELTIPTPPIHLLHARLLLLNGDTSRAVGEYIRAVEGDETLVDEELAVALGLHESESKTNTPSDPMTNDATSEHDAVITDATIESTIEEHEEWSTPIRASEVNDLIDALNYWLTEDDTWNR